MSRSAGENFFGLFLTFTILAFLVIIAVLVSYVALVGIVAYVGYRLWKENPWRLERVARRETELLYDHALSGSVQLLETEIDAALLHHWPPDTPEALQIQLLAIGKALFAQEGLMPEIPPPPALCNTIEGARYRDMMARAGQARGDRVMVLTALDMISLSLTPIARAVPATSGDVLVEVTQFLHPLGQAVQDVIAPFFQDNDYAHFKALRDQLDANLRRTHRTQPIFPTEYKGDDVVDTYLSGTHLKALFVLKTPFEIPEERRFEHTHIIAGSGHGKTQTLQYFIARDLEAVSRRDKSVVVIDSQGDLINTILRARHLPPEQIVLIDPEDIAWPVSLNLFSVGQERLAHYNDLERERLTNSIIELYDFVLGSLLAAAMTSKQSVVFRYVTRLMFYIPGATIHTLRELMEPGGAEKYQEHIAKLDGTARRFFETEFDSKEFAPTKTQVLRRLYGVLENQTFERMFSNPTSRFDMFTELGAGKLILINTAKSLLKEQGTEIFGRFFIALIAQAAQERATLPDRDRLPAMVYVDEAQDYFDRNIGVILSQARKYRVGMTMAHQYLGQLSSGLQEAFEANTSIKLAGGVSARDARSLAGQMSCDPDTIQRQPKGTFATFVRGLTDRAVPISFPFFVLENMPKATEEERDAIRELSRINYADPWQNTAAQDDPPGNEKPEETEEIPLPDPTEPSPEL
ncbi:type IV secretory system conjugative DNA transfer family protein [Pseudoruegeria sp. HB172150]|uniref:type IV secretory system conjugative DNA transfer family protein n=1 Tax=Pseudoruegeria sp. HB172150 TaxID=2721164 RepID=UPI001C13127D|nr:type IV secretion system DNA-binding domain-containing protein [Pseudoruegeria sp. HB172150]